MQTLSIPDAAMPTLSKLGSPIIPGNLDVKAIVSEWFASFSTYAGGGDVEGLLSIIVDSSFASNIFNSKGNDAPSNASDIPVYWRDLLALTWDFRRFEGVPRIKDFLSSQLCPAQISNSQLYRGVHPVLQTPFPDIAWIQFLFTFETTIGLCSGVARLVPTAIAGQELQWKAHCLFINLDNLKGHPEKIGLLRNQEPNHGKWEVVRQKEISFEGRDPTVLIIGGRQSGLNVAARLNTLGVSNLVIEKNVKIGDGWRTRYDALCMHLPICRWAHSSLKLALSPSDIVIPQDTTTCLTFLGLLSKSCSRVVVLTKCHSSRFPQTWPAFASAKKVFHTHIPVRVIVYHAHARIIVSKLARILLSLRLYADAQEINVWTSSAVVSVTRNSETKV